VPYWKLPQAKKLQKDYKSTPTANPKGRIGSRLVQECWEVLNKVSEQKQVSLVWISAQSPITAEPHIELSS